MSLSHLTMALDLSVDDVTSVTKAALMLTIPFDKPDTTRAIINIGKV